jgi:hypothetical protein
MNESYTIAKIQDEMILSGSHWWNNDTMSFFNTRVINQTFETSEHVYFVTSERPQYGTRKFSVRKYHKGEKDITTEGEFCSMTKHIALKTAKELAEKETEKELV